MEGSGREAPGGISSRSQAMTPAAAYLIALAAAAADAALWGRGLLLDMALVAAGALAAARRPQTAPASLYMFTAVATAWFYAVYPPPYGVDTWRDLYAAKTLQLPHGIYGASPTVVLLYRALSDISGTDPIAASVTFGHAYLLALLLLAMQAPRSPLHRLAAFLLALNPLFLLLGSQPIPQALAITYALYALTTKGPLSPLFLALALYTHLPTGALVAIPTLATQTSPKAAAAAIPPAAALLLATGYGQAAIASIQEALHLFTPDNLPALASRMLSAAQYHLPPLATYGPALLLLYIALLHGACRQRRRDLTAVLIYTALAAAAGAAAFAASPSWLYFDMIRYLLLPTMLLFVVYAIRHMDAAGRKWLYAATALMAAGYLAASPYAIIHALSIYPTATSIKAPATYGEVDALYALTPHLEATGISYTTDQKTCNIIDRYAVTHGAYPAVTMDCRNYSTQPIAAVGDGRTYVIRRSAIPIPDFYAGLQPEDTLQRVNRLYTDPNYEVLR